MLLFWPCSWGLAYAYNFNYGLDLFLYYLLLFFWINFNEKCGCIVNDIVDKDFDKRVRRTKNRPIASGRISIKHSFIYVIILCLIAFLILIQQLFNYYFRNELNDISFSYPFMKRVTYWPQLFLGITTGE